MLTGRNHHSSGNGFLMEWATGFPSYSTLMPPETATIGEILKGNGYTTWWFGKNHNTPDWETTVAGPFDRWPTGMGFDYFYGFNAGETHQYYPVIFENTVPVEPETTPEEGYHFMTDMTDRAIARMKFSKSVAPDKPFFMYFAPGAMHAPHHVTAEWRDQFDGAFDMGWEAYREQVFEQQKEMGIIPADTELTPRPDWVQPWDELSDEQKEVYTALMENFAGFFAFTDHEIGRLLDAVKDLPDAENTMVIYIVGDNGASSEGGMDGTLNEIKALNGIPTTSTRSSRTSRCSAGRNPNRIIRSAGPGPGTRRSSGSSRSPRISAARATRWSSAGPRGSSTTPRRAPRSCIWSTWCRRSSRPRTSRCPSSVNGVEQKPLEGECFLASFDDPDFDGRSRAVFRGLLQPLDVRRRLEGQRPAHLPLAAGLRPRQLGRGRVGTLQPRRGLLGSQRSRRRKPGEAG